jgi:putative two-component system response regulator
MTRDEIMRTARILVVDDQEVNVSYLERLLMRAGATQVLGETDPRRVLPIYLEQAPDLLVLDLMMPYLDGFAVMAQLRSVVPPEEYRPILVLTADASEGTKRRALAAGAHDFLTKPFDPVEGVLRIGNLLETRFLHQQIQRQNQVLEERVRERTRDLEAAQNEVLERLARAAEYRDDATGEHIHRVGETCGLMAAALGLPGERVDLLRRAAPLHDVGKIGIPDAILLKPGKLTPDEFAVMQTHTTIGAEILSGGRSPLVRLAQEIALTHQERWDGSGYPQGLAGEAIPLESRIVALVDVLDALTHERPYKAAWPLADAIIEIQRQSGRQFDPRLVEIFTSLYAQGHLA